MPILTLGWLSLIGATAAEVVSAAAQTGFKSVSIRITGRKPGDGFPEIVGNPARMREVKKLLADGGLRMSNTSVYHMPPEMTLETLKPAIDASAELGSSIIVATCQDPDHRRWADFVAKFAEAAGKGGMKVALEVVPFSQCRTFADGDRIVQMAGAKNFGLLVDALHLSRSGGTPADIKKIDPAHIVFSQLCDAVAAIPPLDKLPDEARTGRLYPGDGALPLYDFLDALPAGVEIECEVPRSDYAKLSPVEQAKRAGEAMRAYLAEYCKKRGKPAWI